MSKGSTLTIAPRPSRAALLLLLLLYVVPVLILPACHLVDDWLERRGCFECAEASHALASGFSLEDESTPDAPCRVPGHHHHNHAPHDAAHCVVCASATTFLTDRPSDAGPFEVVLPVALALLSPDVRTPSQISVPATFPRAPPV